MDLARLLAPRDPDLARIARELHAARPDLQAAYADPDGAGFRQWLAVNGPLEDARVARHFPALPPDELRASACGGATLQTHLYTGAEDFRSVGELYETFAERPLEALRSVLDFGCGCGRLLRWFQTALPHVALHGADVRKASVAWCRQHLRGTFVDNGTLPPLPLADESVELTVALSVFSHLSLQQNLAWLRELVRVTRRDGLLLLTTHGAFALAACARHAHLQQLLEMTPAQARAALRALHRDRFVHVEVAASTHAIADGVATDYGNAFFGERFVQERWSAVAEVLGCVPVGMSLFQDYHVLRPRR
jgi:SAM-dependent methyltransferase